jgi:hypothetical protein
MKHMPEAARLIERVGFTKVSFMLMLMRRNELVAPLAQVVGTGALAAKTKNCALLALLRRALVTLGTLACCQTQMCLLALCTVLRGRELVSKTQRHLPMSFHSVHLYSVFGIRVRA